MKNRIFFLLLFIVLIPWVGFAQPGDPGGNPDVPITGIEYLLGGGALLGLRQYLSRKKLSRKE